VKIRDVSRDFEENQVRTSLHDLIKCILDKLHPILELLYLFYLVGAATQKILGFHALERFNYVIC
jgi:hypothetical protein